MKKIVLGIIIVLVVGAGVAFFFSPKMPDQSKIATVTDTNTGTTNETGTMSNSSEYNVAANSTVTWIGRKVGGEHTGTIAVSDGSINVENDQIKGGKFTIDMTKIVNTDVTDADGNKTLVGHLEGTGFFDIAQFPTAEFVLKNVTSSGDKYTVQGDLTLKGVTKEIQFPANIVMGQDSISVAADFFIEKELWNVTSLPIIDKYIGLQFNLVFTK